MATSADYHPSGPGHERETTYAGPPELRSLDAMLARQAGRLRVPPGLIQRVFEASVAGLPSPRQVWRRASHPEPVIATVSLWSRLALAASIGLAFIVATQSLRRPAGPLLLSPEMELVLMGDARDTRNGLYRLLLDSDVQPLGEVEHLLLTRDMTFDDLDYDLTMLVADLDM